MKKIVFILIVSLLVLPMSVFAGEETAPSGMKESELEDTVDDIAGKYVGKEKEIPGAAIAIVKDGEIVLEKGYGFSNLEKEEKTDPQKTVFEAASISKLYTWSAVMQLVEDGEMDLEKDIRHYLPDDYLELEYSDPVTMQHLMNHTAGFEDKAEHLLTEDPSDIIPLHTFLSKKENQPEQVFCPGTVTAYSNFSSSVAGYIIERVSGEDFADYMQSNILNELDMERSTFKTDYSQLPDITEHKSTGYEKQGKEFTSVDWAYVNDAPAGALNTTVHDMAHFMLAQLGADDYSLFNQSATLREMHQQTSEKGETAHGFWQREVDNQRVLQHGGNSTGFTTQLYLVPEEDFGMVLLTNVADESSHIRTDLMEALIGKQDVPDEAEFSSQDKETEGTYRMARGVYSNFQKILPVLMNQDVTVKQQADGGIELHSALFGQEPVTYTKTGDFSYERVDDTTPRLDKMGEDTSHIHFETAENGQVTALSYGGVSDLLPVSIKDRADVNQGVLAVSLLTFLAAGITSLICRFIRKRKKREQVKLFSITGLVSSTGIITIANIGVILIRFINDPFQEIASYQIHLWLNWVMPIVLIVGIYVIIKQWKTKSVIKNGARLWLLTVSSLLVWLLWNFNLL